MFRRLLPLLALLPMTMPAVAQDRVLNVYNWSDYIDPYAVARFTRETGIRVRYDVYDSLETLEGRLSAGRSGYDIVVPTSEPTFARLVRAGALRPIDRAAVPNWRNLDPVLMDRVAAIDPGNRHGAIYLWGTVGPRHPGGPRARGARRRAARQSRHPAEAGECRPPRALRHHGDGQPDGCDALRAALARPRPQQQRGRGPARRRAGADGHPPRMCGPSSPPPRSSMRWRPGRPASRSPIPAT